MRSKRTFLLGKTAKGGDVELEIELRDKARGIELSIISNVWRPDRTGIESGGQNREVIAEVATWAGDWIKATAPRMVEVWKRWHLNGMVAGCEHQQAEKWAERPIDPSKPTDTYGKHFAGQLFDSWNMLVWVSRDEHPEGLLSYPCPTCGYKYGTAWLTEQIPADVLVEIRGWLDADLPAFTPPAPLASFLAKYGIEFKNTSGPTHRLKRAKWEPHTAEDRESTHWQCRFTRVVDRKRLTFATPFTMGSAHTSPPIAGQVLHCLAMDCAGYENARNFDDWASEYGYEEDSRKAETIYRTIGEQVKELRAFLGRDGYAELLAGEGVEA